MSGTYEPGLGWVPDTPDMYASQSGVDFGGGWAQTIQGIAGTLTNAYAQRMLMQQNQYGQRYTEGQAEIAAAQRSSSNLLLLIAAGVAVFMMLKD